MHYFVSILRCDEPDACVAGRVTKLQPGSVTYQYWTLSWCLCPISKRLAKQLSKKISASFRLIGNPQVENFCLANRSLTGHGPGVCV